MPVQVQEEQTGTFTFPTAVPPGASEVTFTFHLTTGVGPTKPVTLELPA